MCASRSLALLALLSLAPACSDDGARPDLDTGPSEAAVPDTVSEGPAPDAAPTVAPEVDPTPVAVAEWMVAMALSPDPMRDALEQGTVTYPKPGVDSNGMSWSVRVPDADGSLGDFPVGAAYAVARLQLKASDHVLIRSEPTYRVWVGGTPYPGDVYASHRIRVPLLPQDGENLVVMHIYGRGGEVTGQLWTTPDEVLLNLDDLTVPDLVAGDSATLCVGVPLLNLTDGALLDVTARVVASGELEGTSVSYPGLAAGAVTQLAFEIKPVQPLTAGDKVEATLQVQSPSLKHIYQRKVTLDVVSDDGAFRRTRVSGVDGSCQYYAVLPPTSYDPSQSYALALSLHGAGVEALNQAKSYAPKDWAFVVAPTNRRHFGFDWEVWGRLDAIEALDHAMQSFPIDPTRVYLTGHSMGGHGTWHVGVMHPGRFALIGPSAGWSSFYSYTGATKPTGVFARTQAHSDTNVYLSNLAQRAVYILHGSADDNVPVTEGQDMYQAVQQVTQDVVYHEEPGAGHWWDKDTTKEGVDCVDWDPLFTMMQARTLDPVELDFDFKTPAPWVNPTHAFVTLLSQLDAMQDSTVSSTHAGSTVTLTTTNVRGMELDGDALTKKGVTQVVVDGQSHAVTAGTIKVGPQDGKRPGVHGPFNELFYRPWCFVYPDSGAAAFERHAAYLVSAWAVLGNGHACALPLSRLAQQPPADRNLIFVGVQPGDIPGASLPFSWSASQLSVAGKSYSDASLYLVFPHKDRLGGAIFATAGAEHLLTRIQPFTSRLVLPDYLVFAAGGLQAAGLFDAQWK